MFSRAYRAAVTVPPLLWVAVFLLAPYVLLLCYSFWSVTPSQAIIHSWTLNNYRELLTKDVYHQTLFRSMWIAARVTLFSLLSRLSAGLLSLVLCRKTQRPLLSVGRHSTLGQLPCACLRVENNPGERWRPEHIAPICSSNFTPFWTFFCTVLSPSC